MAGQEQLRPWEVSGRGRTINLSCIHVWKNAQEDEDDIPVEFLTMWLSTYFKSY